MRVTIFLMLAGLMAGTVAYGQTGWKQALEKKDAILHENEPAKKLQMLDAWRASEPGAPANIVLLWDDVYADIAAAFAENEDVDKALYYLSKIKDRNKQEMGYDHAATTLLENRSYTALARLLKPIVETMVQDSSRHLLYRIRFIGRYAGALYGQQQYVEALRYGRLAWELSRRDSSGYVFTETEENYALALAANNNDALALPLVDTLMAQGRAVKRIREILPAVYAKARGDSNGYNAHLTVLQESLRRRIRANLEGKMIRQTAPAFNLPGLNGGMFSLEAWKGKTVIIDFWGMSCVPCKRSFPAMQAAMDRYKSDTNIMFVYINEMASNPVTEAQRQEVRRYLAANGYTFNVLLDNRKPGSWNWETGSGFQVNALPTKFVIDKNGQIRFKIYGFSGDEYALLEELSVMIMLASTS